MKTSFGVKDRARIGRVKKISPPESSRVRQIPTLAKVRGRDNRCRPKVMGSPSEKERGCR